VSRFFYRDLSDVSISDRFAGGGIEGRWALKIYWELLRISSEIPLDKHRQHRSLLYAGVVEDQNRAQGKLA